MIKLEPFLSKLKKEVFFLKKPPKTSLFYFNGFKMGFSQKFNHGKIFIEASLRLDDTYLSLF